MEMFNKEVVVRCESGLHNRQATYFVQKANEFESSIWLESGSRRMNAKSLLGIMSLGVVTGTTAVSYTHLDVYKRQEPPKSCQSGSLSAEWTAQKRETARE